MTFSLHRSLRALLVLLLVLCLPFSGTQAATGTIMPTPFQTVLDTNGNPVSGAKICTYLAGTTTPTATYTDSALLVPNSNPIVADSAGRFTAYLSPGASYKFIYQDATGTAGTCNGVAIKTVDNVFAVPPSAANLDITGTAGEALTAGQVVYLSDGSGGKTAGQWYKADSANSYSSSAAVSVGMVPAAILSAASGTIRLGGSMTGLTVTLGTTYYVGTSGALTATQPTNSRVVGIADSTSSLILSANPGIPNADNGLNDFRLTLTTGTPVTTGDVTAATTIYCTPGGRGNRISLYDAAGNATLRTSAEFSIAVPASTSQTYDIFAYSNSGVPTLELLAWTNDTTRATAIVLTTTGTYTKSGDLTRRYLGSFRTTTVSGQTEDSYAKRYLWNYYNRVRRISRVFESTDSWNYTTATWRQANGAAANQLDFVIGVAEVGLHAQALSVSSNTSVGARMQTAIGEDSTTTPSATHLYGAGDAASSGLRLQNTATLDTYPAVGRHFYAWLEFSAALGTTTWYGDNGASSSIQTGIEGWIEG